jgi:hypothetical protein
VGGIVNDNLEEEKQTNRQSYQYEAVSGGHPNFEEDGE